MPIVGAAGRQGISRRVERDLVPGVETGRHGLSPEPRVSESPSSELEAILRSHHPAVADAAVIPVPDERAGELPKAYVVPARQVTPQELIDYVAARVAPHKRIHQVSFTDAIPTSPSGKTLRRLLIAAEQPRS